MTDNTPIDPEFNDVEHFQSVCRKAINPLVREHFKDIDSSVELSNISTPRSSLRRACTHDDTDSLLMTVGKLNMYYLVVNGAEKLPPIYGIPVTTFHESVKFHPQVRLYFHEDLNLVESGYSPLEAEITFRLIGETHLTVTPAKATVTANKIKNLFCANKGFTWKKGREKWVYKDEAKGYDFRLLAWNETEAKKVIEQVLDIQNHSPDWDYLSVATKKKTYLTIPGSHNVYGKLRRKPRERPIGYVRFRYAELKVWGMNDITLVDRTGFRRSPLVAV